MKDSDIPLNLLFNKDINEYKIEEHFNDEKPKPIRFIIESDFEPIKTVKTNVKFEIEGAGKAIQSSFVRTNEQTFFEFLNEFDDKSTKNFLDTKPVTK